MLGEAVRLIEEATASRLVPGAVVGVVDATGAQAIAVAGKAQWVPEERALAADMWFDLASLTKVIATVTQVMRLVEQGALALADPLGRFLPEATPAVAAVTFEQALTHQAGFEPFLGFERWSSDPQEIRRRVIAYDWKRAAPVYSDIGYILVALALERLTSRDFAETPLGAELSFRPPRDLCVPTEIDPWRGRLLIGEVHDERAAALGGAAGHAGLFGTAAGVLEFAHRLFTGRALGAEAMAELRRPRTEQRALGWVRQHAGWSGGALASPQSLGHTGFTGTGLWIDFARGRAWTLLTSRVHPDRTRTPSIEALRRAVGEAIARA
ncbi:MAG: class A beta-lactamase-related serine hydrolase [Alphaproteobacteria bacterium]|nr:class A beta-lactamase-related serine hydrolase [Alphaproteobacteria bacterium]